jgi:hypothetical protein
VLLLFENKGTSGRSERHDAVLRNYYSTRGGVYVEIEERSENLETIWALSAKELLNEWGSKGDAINVLFDLSACPRFFPLGLLATGVAAGAIRTAYFIYNEAEYEEKQKTELFTRGSWEDVEIPGFAGALNPGQPRVYVVSVGFEGAKTLRFVNRADPDRIAVLFPKPGYRDEYPERTWRQNQTLFSDYGIADLASQAVVTAPAGDAVRALQALSAAQLEGSGRENVYYLCCGPKPHSLALALRAITANAGVVLYPKPSAHRESEIRPSAEYWLYSVEDRSIPREAPG